MVKLKIININSPIYILESKNGNSYTLNLQFFDIEDSPKMNDYIFISEQLLNPEYIEYSTNYVFGGLESPCGRKVHSREDIDVIKLVVEEKEYYLKRLYG